MKKILIILLLLAAPVYAANFRGTSEALRVPGTQIIQVFDNVSTVDQSVSVNPSFLPDQGTMQIVANDTPTTYDVVVECSLISDTGPWFVLLSLEQTDLTGGHYAAKACPFVQVRLEAITGGGSMDAYIIYRGN